MIFLRATFALIGITASGHTSIQTSIQSGIQRPPVQMLLPEVPRLPLGLHLAFTALAWILAPAICLCLRVFTTSDNLPVWTKMPETNIDRVCDANHSFGTLLLKVGQRFIVFIVMLEISERKTFTQHCSWWRLLLLWGYAPMYLSTLNTLMKTNSVVPCDLPTRRKQAPMCT